MGRKPRRQQQQQPRALSGDQVAMAVRILQQVDDETLERIITLHQSRLPAHLRTEVRREAGLLGRAAEALTFLAGMGEMAMVVSRFIIKA